MSEKRHPLFDKKMAAIVGVPEKSGDVGVELEVEGFNLPTTPSGWDVKVEPSLRGKNGRIIAGEESEADTPREYVTRGPVALSSLEKKLENLSELLTQQHVKVNLTQRASTHVHLNMTGETLKTFMAFLLLYVCIEPLLLRLCGPVRNGNLFCIPTYESGDMAQFIRRLAYNAGKTAIAPWPQRGKYASMNTDPICTLGSVEIRCFPNSVTPATVLKWATWVVNLRDLARKSDDTFVKMLDALYGNPWSLIKSVFGDEDVYTPTNPQHPTELVLFGVTEAYEIWREMRPFLDYKEKKRKVDLFDDALIYGGPPGSDIFEPTPSAPSPWLATFGESSVTVAAPEEDNF